MNITVEKQPNCLASLRVEIPSEAVKSERDRIVASYTSQARIQGFRPGKAPRKVIEKRFGESIASELEERLARQAFDEALKKEKLKVLEFGAPQDFAETADGSVSFQSKLVLAPEVQLPEYKGITVKSPPAELSDAEFEAQLEALRERFAEHEDVTDRAAENGDLAVIDYRSTLDGKPLEEALGKPAGHLGDREGYWLRLDGASFLPGFTERLVGASTEETREIPLTLPDDFPVAGLAGRELVFTVTVKQLKRSVLPELDDGFAAKLTGGQTLEELKTTLRERATYEKRRRLDDHKVNQIVEHFNALVDFELPEDLLRHETQSQADGLVERGVKAGMSEEEIAAQQAEIFATAGAQARTNLKTNFILQEIARVEEITVGDQELVGHLASIAQQRKENPKQFIEQLRKDGRLPGIRNSMLVGKAIDFVLEHATVEELEAEIPASQDDE